MKKHVSSVSMALGTVGVLYLASYFKITGVQGSFSSFFSLAHIIAPLVGAFAGISGSLAVFGSSFIIRLISMPFISIVNPFYHLPSLCASLYWAGSRAVIRVGVPLLCMALFIAHPIGWHAAPYALFWLIPIAIHFLGRQQLFLTALGSTFTAHAVGSVVYLYIINPMTPQAWLALIPIVPFERLLFASGMVIVYSLVQVCLQAMGKLLLNVTKQNRTTW